MPSPRTSERCYLTLAWILLVGVRHNRSDGHRPRSAAAAVEAFASVQEGAYVLASPRERNGARRRQGGLARQHASPFSDISHRRWRMSRDDEDVGADETRQQGVASPTTLATSSRLSHVMLKVPSVDNTVTYWKEQGGKVTRSSRKKAAADDGDAAPLGSAFLELGCYDYTTRTATATTTAGTSEEGVTDATGGAECFALELVTTEKQKNYQLGNVISYIGISRLLNFQANKEHLRELLMKGEGGPSKDENGGNPGGGGAGAGEPNGIPIQKTAAAPGDFFARFALKSKDLDATRDFYTTVLGMKLCMCDADVICLRYDNEHCRAGIPTTLVFERAEAHEALVPGDCFDHLAIRTAQGIRETEEHVSAFDCNIFLKPTRMFGAEVMGVLDPNGFKVVIAAAR